MKELQALGAALENMSEAEQMEYVQKKGIAKKITANVGTGKQPAVNMKNVNMDALSFQYSEQYMANAQELLKMEDEARAFDSRWRDKWVTDGYQRRTETLQREKGHVPGLVVDYNSGSIGAVEGAALEKIEAHDAIIDGKIDLVIEEFYNAAAKEWIPWLTKQLSVLKQMLQEDKMMDARSVEVGKMSGQESMQVTGTTSGSAVARAIQYLETAKRLVTLPGHGPLEKTPNS